MIFFLLLTGCSDLQFSLHASSTGRGAALLDSGDTGGGSGDTGGGSGDTGGGGGTGSGSYGTPQIVTATSNWIEYIRTADFNGDGLLDVVYTGSLGSSWTGGGDRSQILSIALQDSGGGFTTTDYPQAHTSGFRMPFEVGDLNDDGFDDIVLGHVDGWSVLLADGTGGFDAAVDYADAWNSVLTLGDVDGDGDLDVAQLNANLEASVSLNDGTGTFTESDRWSLPWTYSGDWDYSRVAISDLDGDGNADVIAVLPWATVSDAELTLNMGNGDGTFDHATINGTPTADYFYGVYSMAVGDFNSDGAPDVMELTGDHMLFAQSWDGDGLGSNQTYPMGTGYGEEFDAADIDGDGDSDAFVSDFFNVEILLQDGGSLVSQGVLALNNTSAGAVASDLYTLGDMDNDGCKDIVAAYYPDGFAIVPFVCAASDPGDDTGEWVDGDTSGDDGDDTAPPPPSSKATSACATGGTSASLFGVVGALGLLLGRRRRS